MIFDVTGQNILVEAGISEVFDKFFGPFGSGNGWMPLGYRSDGTSGNPSSIMIYLVYCFHIKF